MAKPAHRITLSWSDRGGSAIGWSMEKRFTNAGGFFLTVTILGGFALGVAIGEPMKGVLIGTAIGAVAAVLLWLADRRR